MQTLTAQTIAEKYFENLLRAARHAKVNGIVPVGKEKHLKRVIEVLQEAVDNE